MANALSWLYIAATVLVGGITIGGSILSLVATVSEPEIWRLGVLGFGVLTLGWTYIQLPNMNGRICPTVIFTLFAAIQYGPHAAVLVALLEALVASLQQSTQVLRRILFNCGAVPCAAYFAAHIGERISAYAPLTDFSSVLLVATTVGVAYYFANMSLVLGIIVISGGTSALRSASSALLWTWVNYLAGGFGAAVLCWLNNVMDVGILPQVLLIAVPVFTYYALRHYFGVLRERERALELNHEMTAKIRASYLATLHTLATAIEARDPNTHGHLHRVEALATELGRLAGLSTQSLENLGFAAMLHDVGKLALPEYLLYPSHSLTPQDEKRIRSHSRQGADILAASGLPPEVVPMVLHHHERYDGHGFPFGYKGNEIPIGARILAIADRYDRLRYPPAGSPISHAAALALTLEEAGQGLDPELVAQLGQCDFSLLDASHGTFLKVNAAFSEASKSEGFLQHFQSSHKVASVLYALNSSARTAQTTEELINALGCALDEFVHFHGLLIFLPDDISDDLEFVGQSGIQLDLTLEDAIKLGAYLRRFLNRDVVVLDDESHGIELEPIIHYCPEVRTVAILPVKVSRQDAGAVVLVYRTRQSFTDEMRDIAALVVEQLAPSLARIVALNRADRDAFVDPLTGIHNRRYLERQGLALLRAAQESHQEACAIMIDVNGFKATNDQLGHAQGDRILVEIARLLRSNFRSNDIIIRKGGDEFVILLLGISRSELHLRIEDLELQARNLWPPFWPYGVVGISVGTAFFPTDGDSLATLLDLADQRMYLDKRQKKGLRAAG